MSRGPDPSRAPWPQYAAAVVELIIDGAHIVLTPLPTSERAGDLADWSPPIWVLTAGDPYPVELSPDENAERERLLVAELDAAGVRHDPALGRSADGATSEVSRALRGIDRAQALAIAARHGQLAVYEIEDLIRCVDVASGEVVTEHAFTIAVAAAGSDALVGPTGWRG
jgi:hypothetical protein